MAIEAKHSASSVERSISEAVSTTSLMQPQGYAPVVVGEAREAAQVCCPLDAVDTAAVLQDEGRLARVAADDHDAVVTGAAAQDGHQVVIHDCRR